MKAIFRNIYLLGLENLAIKKSKSQMNYLKKMEYSYMTDRHNINQY